MLWRITNTMFTAFASPARFSSLLHTLNPWLIGVTLLLLVSGTYTALIASPPDYQQGEAVRIMYVHVPAAWCALGLYASMAIHSFIFLVWKHSLADLLSRQTAPIAIAMTTLCLLTGSLWGQPTWGTYWVWDARLTSMLILLVILIGYDMLARQAHFQLMRQKACAILCLFGTINLPIIKFSVEWWNTLHQPASILRSGGIAIDSAMLTPLLLMAGGFFALSLLILSLRIRTTMLQAKLIRQQHVLRRKQQQGRTP